MEPTGHDRCAAPTEPSFVTPRETILWKGHPPTRIRLKWGDIAVIPVFLMVAAMVLSRLFEIPVEVVRIEAPFEVLFGVCVVWLVARLVVDPWIRRRTRYVLTADWLRIDAHPFAGGSSYISMDAVRDITVWRNTDDSGTLVFSAQTAELGVLRTFCILMFRGRVRFPPDGDVIEVESGLKELADLVRARIRAAKKNDARWTS